jgi:hypothetical protein
MRGLLSLYPECTAPDRIQLTNLPPEILVHVLKFMDTTTIGRMDSVSRVFHGELPPPPPPTLVEQSLRQRATERGEALTTLPDSETSWSQFLCWRERFVSLAAGRVHVAAAGQDHSAFIDEHGRLVTCGHGPALGHGEVTREVAVPTPVLWVQGVRVVGVSAGLQHMLALTESGEVLSFGHGRRGVLGHDNEFDRLTPTLIDALRGTRVIGVSAGPEHNLLLSEAGEALSFGDGSSGRLGHGDEQARRASHGLALPLLASAALCDVLPRRTGPARAHAHPHDRRRQRQCARGRHHARRLGGWCSWTAAERRRRASFLWVR